MKPQTAKNRLDDGKSWGAVIKLGLFAVLLSLVLAVSLGGMPLLQSWYAASGVLIAAAGSVAVLSLRQSEESLRLTKEQEEQRNRRESARLTIKTCEELLPCIEALEGVVEAVSTVEAVTATAAIWVDDRPLVRPAVEEHLRSTVAHWARGYHDKVERISHGGMVRNPDSRTPQELQELVEKRVAERMLSLEGTDKTHRPSLRRWMGVANLVAAYLLEAECNVDLARKTVGARYRAAYSALRPLLAMADIEDATIGFPYAARLYHELDQA